MGNQAASQRSVSNERSSKVSSYLSRRGSRKISLNSPLSVHEFLRSTLGRAHDGEDGTLEDVVVDECIPDNIESEFELANPIDGKMHRNLCECTHPRTRVDIMSVARSSGKRTLYVDRQLSAQASDAEVAAAHNDLRMMCYLTTCHHGSQGKRGHLNVIELLGHFSLINSLHIITKYYELGNLLTMLHTAVQLQETSDRRTLPHFRNDASIRNVLRDVFQGVAFIHRSGVAHLDLALDNIYIGLDGKFRVGDFRHARFVGSRNKLQAAPPPTRKVYAAPELYSGREVDLLKADAWSLGVITLMVLTMETPFSEATNRDSKYQLLQLWGLRKLLEDLITERELIVEIPQDMMELLSSLLCCNPEHRATVLEAVESCSWLQPNETTAAGSETQTSTENSAVHTSTSDTQDSSGVEQEPPVAAAFVEPKSQS